MKESVAVLRHRIDTMLDRPMPLPVQGTRMCSPQISDGENLFLRGEWPSKPSASMKLDNSLLTR